MRRETKVSKLLAAISFDPTATNAALAEACGADEAAVRAMLSRLTRRGAVEVDTGDDGRRTLVVIGEPQAVDFKREILETMVARYVEDFDAAELYTERVEIGKMILRILEKL